jgi:hypothetical protein
VSPFIGRVDAATKARARWRLHNRVLCKHKVLAVADVGDDYGHHGVTYGEVLDVRADFGHLAGDIHPWHPRERLVRETCHVGPNPKFSVSRVHCCGPHLDPYLSWTHRVPWQVYQVQDLRSAKLNQANCGRMDVLLFHGRRGALTPWSHSRWSCELALLRGWQRCVGPTRGSRYRLQSRSGTIADRIAARLDRAGAKQRSVAAPMIDVVAANIHAPESPKRSAKAAPARGPTADPPIPPA